ncbi:MAG: pyruvate kinase [Planctomycetes bacterium]|nr:pyruvate kinase [Planctomycetota bacterium]
MNPSTPSAPVLPGVDHTKIVATIGPASEHRIGELIEAGLNVARINFSHGSLEQHRERILRIRAEAHARMTAVGILADLQGPKMRLGRFEGGRRTLSEGEELVVRSGGDVAGPGEVLFDFGGFSDRVEPGHRLLLADGQVELEVLAHEGGALRAVVTRGGEVADRKGVHLPDSDIVYEVPTEEDRRHIEFCNELGVEFLGLSFVGRASELHEIRALAPNALLVAKIERRLALDNLDEILEVADGIMVARGDLGVELDLEQVPMRQKDMLSRALRAGRFTITATEMLESMIESSRPTRAEVADVANAVLDGSDAIMLSAETAVGEHPVDAVRTMRSIARAVEESERYHELPRTFWRASEPDAANAVAMAAVRVADALELSKIVVFTETGRTARLLTRYRPGAEIIALSPKSSTVNQMTLLAGCRPILFRREPSLEDMLYMASEMLVVRGLADYGEMVVFVAGVPPGVARSTNVLKLSKIGEEVRLH